MKKTRWIKRVLEESQKDQIEMPWARDSRQRRGQIARKSARA
ncbi:MAG: hypothetical protein R6U99_00750 [Nioella sp.]